MTRPPPRSTLFPSRRSSDLQTDGEGMGRRRYPRQQRRLGKDRDGDRSEEHTSELQSRRELVCRLLLEKKKQDLCRVSADLQTALSQCVLLAGGVYVSRDYAF